MNIILLGAPGAGKGSLAVELRDKYNIPHISTGDILRDNIKKGTQLGTLAKSYIDQGQLVPDEVVIGIVEDRLTQDDAAKGYILDGFPRTVVQAEALDKVASIDKVINLAVPFEVIEQRLTGRRVCTNAKCGGTFQVSWLADKEVCPRCGSKVIMRDDDKPETVRERLAVYNKQTAPLIDYYRAKGILWDVDGGDTVAETLSRVVKVLEKND